MFILNDETLEVFPSGIIRKNSNLSVDVGTFDGIMYKFIGYIYLFSNMIGED